MRIPNAKPLAVGISPRVTNNSAPRVPKKVQDPGKRQRRKKNKGREGDANPAKVIPKSAHGLYNRMFAEGPPKPTR